MSVLLLVNLLSYFIVVYGFQSLDKEYKKLDGKIAKVIMRPTKEKWSSMLETMEYYLNKLRDPGITIVQDCNKNKEIIKIILKDGCPNYVNLAVDEEYLLNEVGISKSQLKQFYDLRDQTKKTWNKWKVMDKEICSILKESNREKWDGMLKDVETYTEELNNLTEQIIPTSVGVLWPEIESILRTGRPKFITVPVIGPVLKRQFNMTDLQIYQVWVLRNQADQGYDRFIQRITWMKKNHVLDFLKKKTTPKE